MGIEPTALATPATGSELIITVAAGKTQILRCLSFYFATSATVADRYVRLTIDSGSGLAVYYAGENNVAQVAGVNPAYYSFALGYHPVPTAPATNGTYRAFSLPAILLKAGWRVYTNTMGMDTNASTGDTYTQVFYQLQDVNAANADYI